MSRGTGTKKLLDEKTVSKALKGDRATLDELARKGGNRGSSKSDTPAPAATTATAAAQAAENKILTTPVPNEARLAKELGVSVEVIRKMHSQVENLRPDSDVAMNARGIKAAAEAKAGNEGRKDKADEGRPEAEERPWYTKGGPGFWSLLRERGRGSTNELWSPSGGAGEAGGPSVEDLIKKKVVITGKPPVPTVPAPTTPSTGA